MATKKKATAATPKPAHVKSPSGVYLIQDTRQFVGNCVLWWCPKGAGYTTEFTEAGRFTEEEIRGNRDTDVAIPIEAATAACVTHVRAETLSRALDAMRVPS
jgi:hypothetical protein